MKTVLSLLSIIAPALAMSTGACTDTKSDTDLFPEGPPEIRQVRLFDQIVDATDPTKSTKRRVFAFGEHPLALPDEIVPQATGTTALNNDFRIIIDELLVGNNLEEIQCRGAVDDDGFAKVPLGANPDDIARCSVANDVLPATCTGPTAVCICQNQAGCTRDAETIAFGQPVGVQDINQDGATDGRQMVAGSVGIKCGAIDVPIDLANSYYNPSGNQNRPAMGGFDALGPAIVLVPDGPLPTNVSCGLVFAQDIVDKQGIQVCAPTDPSLDANNNVRGHCEGGDMSSFSFKVEALNFFPASWDNNATGVNRTDAATFAVNSLIATGAITGVTVRQCTTSACTASAPFTLFTIQNPTATPTVVEIDWTAPGLPANTTFQVTFPVTITDTFAQPLPAPQVFTFTTGA